MRPHLRAARIRARDERVWAALCVYLRAPWSGVTEARYEGLPRWLRRIDHGALVAAAIAVGEEVHPCHR